MEIALVRVAISEIDAPHFFVVVDAKSSHRISSGRSVRVGAEVVHLAEVPVRGAR